MKRIISVIMMFMLLLSMAGCGSNSDAKNINVNESPKAVAQALMKAIDTKDAELLERAIISKEDKENLSKEEREHLKKGTNLMVTSMKEQIEKMDTKVDLKNMELTVPEGWEELNEVKVTSKLWGEQNPLTVVKKIDEKWYLDGDMLTGIIMMGSLE